MKKLIFYSMIISGTILVALFSYVWYDISTSHPLVFVTLLVHPLLISISLVVVGIILLVTGIWLLLRYKKRMMQDKLEDNTVHLK